MFPGRKSNTLPTRNSAKIDFEPLDYLCRNRSKKILVVTNSKENQNFCGKYIQIISGSDKKNISFPAVYFHNPAQAKKTVDLLQQRISSPQSAYRHLLLPYTLLNIEQIF